MNLLFKIFLTFMVSSTVWACPNCAGSPSSFDKYTVYILAGFIVLTYIPFYIIFKMANKNKDKNQAIEK